MVVEEIQKGYKFKGKVIRPSLVIVGKGGRERRKKQTNQKEK